MDKLLRTITARWPEANRSRDREPVFAPRKVRIYHCPEESSLEARVNLPKGKQLTIAEVFLKDFTPVSSWIHPAAQDQGLESEFEEALSEITPKIQGEERPLLKIRFPKTTAETRLRGRRLLRIRFPPLKRTKRKSKRKIARKKRK